MLIRLLSDVHLELSTNPQKLAKRLVEEIKPADVLILAGDIGNPYSKIYHLFIKEISAKFRKTFVISGNHEYYTKMTKEYEILDHSLSEVRNVPMEEIDLQIRATLSDIPNVIFLQRNSHVFEGVRFIGCTLWSEINPDLIHQMNDYRLIEGLTAGKALSLYKEDVAWLTKQLEEDNRKTVVITHHLPSLSLVDAKYAGYSKNCFYASNLDHLVAKAQYWCYGHSHTANMDMHGKCLCFINPLGYSSEKTGYNLDLDFTV